MELRKIRKLLPTIEKESFGKGLANEILWAERRKTKINSVVFAQS